MKIQYERCGTIEGCSIYARELLEEAVGRKIRDDGLGSMIDNIELELLSFSHGTTYLDTSSLEKVIRESADEYLNCFGTEVDTVSWESII